MEINKFQDITKEVEAIKSAIGRLEQLLDYEKVEFKPPVIEQKELKYDK
jgi:hypothetical protein